MSTYDAGEASLRIVPSFKGALELIDAEATRWGVSSGSKYADAFRLSAEAGLRDLNVGVGVDTAKATVEIDEFRARAGRDIDIGVDVDHDKIDLAEHSVSALSTAIITLGPTLVPIGAAFIGAFAGTAAMLGAVAGGLGVVALGAKGVATAVKGEVVPAVHEMQQTAAEGLLPGVDDGIHSLLTLLPEVDGFVGSLARNLGGLSSEAADALTGSYWQQFYRFIEGEAGPTIDEFGHIIGNLAHGFAGLIVAFAPVTHEIGTGLEHLTSDFAAFGANANDSSSFQGFLVYIDEEGPKVVHTLLDIGGAVGHIAAAVGPLGSVTLGLVDDLARLVEVIPTPLLTAAAAAFVTFKLAELGAAGANAVFGKSLAVARAVGLSSATDEEATSMTGLASKAGLVIGTIIGVYESAKALSGVFNKTTVPSVTEMTTRLIALNAAGAATPGWLNDLTEITKATGGGFFDLTKILSTTDEALASLVAGGHLDLAKADFDQISAALRRGGASTEDITNALPAYSDALQQSANSAKLAGTGVDQFGNQVGAAAVKTRSATQAAKDYSDQLHALADPLFAENQALQDLRSKQDAYNKAIQQHGRDSAQARQALEDMASSSLDVAAASRTLQAAVHSGDISIAKARDTLHTWVSAGLISRDAAHGLIDAWGGLITRSHGITTAIGADAKSHAWSEFAGAAKTAVNDVLTSLGVGAKKAPTLGTQLAQGYAAGMASDGAIGAVVGAAVALVNAALAAIHSKKGQDSNSPARKFIPAGLNAAEGYAKGMDLGTPMVVGAAQRMVAAAISAAVSPASTDPTVLAGLLGGYKSSAIATRGASIQDRSTYQTAAQNLRDVTRATTEATAAAKKHAQELSNEAYAAKTGSAALDAAKHSLEAQARAASQNATEIEKAGERQVAAAKRTADEAKNVWDKAKAAADAAAQAAADAARALVSNLSDALTVMQGKITDFESSVSDGLTGDDSFTSLWSSLGSNFSSASGAVTSALATVTSAQDALTKAQNTVAASKAPTANELQAVADATQSLADAQSQLAAAQSALADAPPPTVSSLQSSLDQVLAQAQSFATDLNTLIGEGATQALISQLVGMGPAAGGALAAQLVAAGPDSVTKLSATLDQISSYTADAAKQMAATFYGGGVSAMEQFIDGLIKTYPELTAALAPMLAALQATFIAATSATNKAATTPHFASGVQDFVGGWATVGENGTETVWLPPGANVYPHGWDGASLMPPRPVLSADSLSMSGSGLNPRDLAALADAVVTAAESLPPRQVVMDGRIVGDIVNGRRQSERESGNSAYR